MPRTRNKSLTLLHAGITHQSSGKSEFCAELPAVAIEWRAANCGKRFATAAAKQRIRADYEAAGPQLHQRGKDCVEIAVAARMQDMNLQPERARSRLQVSRLRLRIWIGRIDEEAERWWRSGPVRAVVRSRFGASSSDRFVVPVRLPPWLRFRLVTRPNADRVDARKENDRYGRGRGLGCLSAWKPTIGDNQCNAPANELGGERRQALVLIICPQIVNRYVAPLNKAGLAQPLANRFHAFCKPIRRLAAEISNHRQWLLHARATSGHAAAAQPRRVMNSRRRIMGHASFAAQQEPSSRSGK